MVDKFGKTVKLKLKQKRLRQEEFSKILGISEKTLSFRLHGKSPWRDDELEKIEKELGVKKA